MKPTRHFLKRHRQRGFHNGDEEVLMNFGSPQKAPGKALKFTLSGGAYTEAIHYYKGMIATIERLKGRSVIVSEDCSNLVTIY